MGKASGTTRLVVELPDAEALALAQLCKRFSYADAQRLADAFDGGRERDAMIDGVGTLRRALCDAGHAPR